MSALLPSTVQDEAQPLALIGTVKNAQVLTAVNDAAAAAGLSSGMTLSHARALVPDIKTVPADHEGDHAALESLADWCGRYSPSYGLHDEPDDHGLWIEATGCAHLFGGEEAMLADLGQRLSSFGLRHRLSMAPTPGAAWALARYHPVTQVVEHDNGRDALNELPVAGLRLSPETLTLLRRLGLKTIGQLNALPRAALGKRFSSKETGEAVLLRLDQLFGRREEPLRPRKPLPIYRVEQAFLDPLIEPEPLSHGLAWLTSDLSRMLIQADQGAERLAFLAFRVDGDVKMIKVGASQATHDVDHISRLFAEKLPTIDPGFGIEKLALHAERTAPIEKKQKTLEGGSSDVTDQDERFSQLIDRLTNRLGPDAITVAIPVESHIPKDQRRAVSGLTCKAWTDMPQTACRPSCLLLRPEPIKALAEVPDGPPLRFTWRRVTHRVVKAEGPERIAPEWWIGTADSVDLAGETRDYYRVEDEHGRRYWLFRQGLYDTSGYLSGDAKHQATAVGRADQVDATDRIGWFIHGLFG